MAVEYPRCCELIERRADVIAALRDGRLGPELGLRKVVEALVRDLDAGSGIAGAYDAERDASSVITSVGVYDGEGGEGRIPDRLPVPVAQELETVLKASDRMLRSSGIAGEGHVFGNSLLARDSRWDSGWPLVIDHAGTPVGFLYLAPDGGQQRVYLADLPVMGDLLPIVRVALRCYRRGGAGE